MKTTEYNGVNDSIRSYTIVYGRRNARPGPIFINDLSSEQQLEHNMTTAIQIDHFLTQYCSVQTNDLTKTKVILFHDFKVHEEQLYEMFMHLRHTFGYGTKENIDKNNLAASLSKMLRGLKPVGYNRT